MSEENGFKMPTAFSPEEQKKITEWSKRIRKKHSVPQNYSHMIDRARIDEYIAWSENSDFIFVYDDKNILCKCSYGKISYDLPQEYGEQGDNSKARVEKWKKIMREKYSVPQDYEIIMGYGLNNNVDQWIFICEIKKAAPAKHASRGGIFWFFADGHSEYAPTEYEYNYSLKSEYKSSDDGKDMPQEGVDCIAHFLQVGSVIRRSSWYQYRPLYQANMNGDGLERADLPSLEQTVFALLYMRQLIGGRGNDELLKTACDWYIKHAANTEKSEYVEQQKTLWTDYLQKKPSNVELAKIIPDNAALLETFQYGALIIHAPHRVRSQENRNFFKRIFLDESNRVAALWELNFLMKLLFGYAANIAVLIQDDFISWIDSLKIPTPDVVWQQDMFSWEPVIEKKEISKDKSPKFGVAYNVEIREVHND